MAFARSRLFVACLCSLKLSRSVRLVSPIYCFFFYIGSYMLGLLSHKICDV